MMKVTTTIQSVTGTEDELAVRDYPRRRYMHPARVELKIATADAVAVIVIPAEELTKAIENATNTPLTP